MRLYFEAALTVIIVPALLYCMFRHPHDRDMLRWARILVWFASLWFTFR